MFSVFPVTDTVLLQRYVTANLWPMLVAWALSLAVILVLACVRRVHRYPYNYMLLLAFTTAFSVLVGCITARYDVEVIAMAFAATAAAVLGAWAVAAFTPFDLTNKGGILISILFGVICVSFIGIFWQNRCSASPTAAPHASVPSARLSHVLSVGMCSRAPRP